MCQCLLYTELNTATLSISPKYIGKYTCTHTHKQSPHNTCMSSVRKLGVCVFSSETECLAEAHAPFLGGSLHINTAVDKHCCCLYRIIQRQFFQSNSCKSLHSKQPCALLSLNRNPMPVCIPAAPSGTLIPAH